MKSLLILLLVLIWSAGCTSASEPVEKRQHSVSDEEIRDLIVQASISAYSGNCPCPYNRASDGSRCGGRSAYTRPGGASPICYPNQISQEMVEQYRAVHRFE